MNQRIMNKRHLFITTALGAALLYHLYWMLSTISAGFRFWDTGLASLFVFYVLLTVAGLTGLFTANSSGFKKTGLLRMYMCFGFIAFLFYTWGIWIFIKEVTRSTPFMTRNPFNWQFYLNIFVSLLHGLTCCYGLWTLNPQRVPMPPEGGEDAGVEQLVPAGTSKRFINWFTDNIIVSFFVLNFFSYRAIPGLRIRGSQEFFFTHLAILFFYYLLLEGVFKTSAGKALTGTVAVNEYGEKASFGRALTRSLCRLIPFDAFSFLGGGRGWHDRLSGTWVVRDVDKETAEKLKLENQFDFEVEKVVE
jgi:uncharacterized RDD family membrane protein YckC